MSFHKLTQTAHGMSVSYKKPFSAKATAIKPETIKLVFDFAFAMTFGKKGAHRNHRTGGSNVRKNGEIFADTFQGKLAECAACNLFYKVDPSVKPDFSISQLGTWDSVDVVVKGKWISVKSTKSYGNLLLLEQRDWDDQGNYLPNLIEGHSAYDYFLLVRIKPFCEDIMKSNRWLYSDSIDKEELWKQIQCVTWTYDYAGYITHDDLKEIIDERFILHKGTLLNGSTKIDADNYYIQAGDMPDVSNLLLELRAHQEETAPARNQSLKRKPKWYDFLLKLIKWFK